jgi:hypothetical protein
MRVGDTRAHGLPVVLLSTCSLRARHHAAVESPGMIHEIDLSLGQQLQWWFLRSRKDFNGKIDRV